MDKLTKEQCLEAFNHILHCDRDTCSNISDAYRNDLSTLHTLINEHFAKGKSCKGCQLKEDFKTLSKVFDCLLEDYHKLKNNPPLNFEEIKPGMWIWDNKIKEYLKVYDLEPTNKRIWLGSICYMNFEENRFYRKEVKE